MENILKNLRSPNAPVHSPPLFRPAAGSLESDGKPKKPRSVTCPCYCRSAISCKQLIATPAGEKDEDDMKKEYTEKNRIEGKQFVNKAISYLMENIIPFTTEYEVVNCHSVGKTTYTNHKVWFHFVDPNGVKQRIWVCDEAMLENLCWHASGEATKAKGGDA